MSPSKLAQGGHVLTCIREILGSNLGRDTDYRDWDFPSFSRFTPGYFLKLGRERFLPHSSQSFDASYSQLLTAPLSVCLSTRLYIYLCTIHERNMAAHNAQNPTPRSHQMFLLRLQYRLYITVTSQHMDQLLAVQTNSRKD
jgi:hypothetical protein